MLSKSLLMSSVQCPRKIWLEVRRPDLTPDSDPGAERRKHEGNQVGEIARRLMGPVIWPKSLASKERSAEAAKALLESRPTEAAVEVPLFFDNVYARADALYPESSGYVLKETKATTFPLKSNKVTPDKPDVEYILDLAIQAWVMENSGYFVARMELNLVNNRIPHPGKKDYSQLFRVMDVTAEARAMMGHVPELVATARETIAGDMPVMQTGKQCTKPHGCPYQSFCKTQDAPKPEHPIELLPDSAGKKLAAALKAEFDYVSILEPSAAQLAGKQQTLYLRIQKAHRTGRAFLDRASGKLLENLPYPRYYFDFEGIDLAVPEWEGVRPYEQIPFQWSCHIERSPGVFKLGEFLDLTGKDPSLGCIQKMLKVIDSADTGPIYVYYATYERGRLLELAKRHPKYAEELNLYAERLIDLHPIVKDNFYHPDMQGSFSIKKVLPVIAPDLDYSKLSEVNDGTGAQLAYIKAAVEKRLTKAEKAITRKNAKMYCRQDTWAMVEVAYFLARRPRPVRPKRM